MTPALPTWVTKRDGRREPFEADKISQALFAASEAAGAANAFLARELADGVLHFLAQETADDVVATEQIAEVVEKVVRELGQPALAQAFGRRLESEQRPPAALDKAARKAISCTFPLEAGPEAVTRGCLEAYSLQAIFGRDLAAAHEEGLIALGGLAAPAQLASVVAEGPPDAAQPGWRAAWSLAEQAAAPCLVIDGVEWFVQAHGAAWLEALAAGLRSQHKWAVLNLNMAAAPRWAQEVGSGPLFAGAAARPDMFRAAAETWQVLRGMGSSPWRIDWHLQQADFDEAPRRRLLEEVTARQCEQREQREAAVAFVFDRPHQPARLAEGCDRDHPAVLLEVGLNLPNFLRRPDVDGDVERLTSKLPSLARMAVRAAAQKRRRLRGTAAELARGFLLERARLVVTPLGLDDAVHTLLRQSMARSRRSLELGRRLVQVLADSLRQESRAANLDIALESRGTLAPDHDGLLGGAGAGSPEEQLGAAAALQRAAGGGTALIRLPTDASSAQRIDLLAESWRRGDVVRLRFGVERA